MSETKSPITILENEYDNLFNELLGSKFLPRVQLYIANASIVKEGKFPMNHFGLVLSKDNIIDLGTETSVFVINWRPRALDTHDLSNIRSSCNPHSDVYQDIKRIADSKQPNNGCQYGPEFLIWVPEPYNEFATFFMGGDTTRREARLFVQLKGEWATLKSKFIKSNNGFSWQTPFGVKCTTEYNYPDDEKNIEVQTNFKPENVPDQRGLEKVEAQPAIER